MGRKKKFQVKISETPPLLLVIHLPLVLPHAIVSAHVAMNAREGFATRKRVARAETTDRTGPGRARQCQAQPDPTRPDP